MTAGSSVHVHALANAIKAQGVIVEVSPNDFDAILRQTEKPLVVHAESKIIRVTHKYLTSYRGMVFYTRLKEPLQFSRPVEMVEAKKLWSRKCSPKWVHFRVGGLELQAHPQANAAWVTGREMQL